MIPIIHTNIQKPRSFATATAIAIATAIVATVICAVMI